MSTNVHKHLRAIAEKTNCFQFFTLLHFAIPQDKTDLCKMRALKIISISGEMHSHLVFEIYAYPNLPNPTLRADFDSL